MNDKSNLLNLKSELALIQNGIAKQKSNNILLGNSKELDSLDDALINKKSEYLFSKVVDLSIVSTNTNEKKVGNWAKLSSNSYIFYLNKHSILFDFVNGSFICKSEKEVCKKVE